MFRVSRFRTWAVMVLDSCVLLGLAAGPVRGELINASTHLGGGNVNRVPVTVGWFFTPNADITVVELGYFDRDQNGLADAHEVGIFSTNGEVLITATIAAGTASNLVGDSRFEPIVPLVLRAETQYYIAGNNNRTDLFVFGDNAVGYGAEIVWNGQGGGSSNSIFSPFTNFGPQRGNLGPNFRYDSQAIPEPGTLTLACVGSLVFFGYAWQRRKISQIGARR